MPTHSDRGNTLIRQDLIKGLSVCIYKIARMNFHFRLTLRMVELLSRIWKIYRECHKLMESRDTAALVFHFMNRFCFITYLHSEELLKQQQLFIAELKQQCKS